MTAGYLLTITIHGFFPGEKAIIEGHEAPRAMWIPMLVLALLSVLVGLFPNVLIGFIETIIAAIFA
jgi:multicomponent Na+:H+ antiporter subunit D